MQTTISYMAYGQPSTDWPILIVQPEGAYTDIVRDSFGKPTSITRRSISGDVAITRSMVYDHYQQLCKTIEPETAARSEDHTSELQSLMRISYAVFCLKKQTLITNKNK